MTDTGATHSTDPDGLRRIAGFYPTPLSVVEMMLVRLAPLERGHRVLEPSAGRGDIADRLRAHVESVTVVEPHPVLAGRLAAKGYEPFACAFEDYEPDHPFDRIAMNPPFARGLDMEHVRRAVGMLAPGGVLVALLNDGDQPGDATPAQRDAFAAWLCAARSIAALSIERLDPSILLSAENFRPSIIPVSLLTVRMFETRRDVDGLR